MAQDSNANCPYKYFISYNFGSAQGTGFGCCVFDRGKPIEDIEDIKAIQQRISEMNNFTDVVILNYILMTSPFMEV